MIENRVKLNKYNWSSIDILYSLCILSIFLVSKIYLILFPIFIFLSLYTVFKDKNINIKEEKWILGAIFFMIFSLITSIYHGQFIFSNYIKLILNISFLISTYLYYKDKVCEDLTNKFIFIVKLIIILNFIQIMWIYLSNGLFVKVFMHGGLENSDTRYIVSQYKTFIGAISKNIWSAKLAFIQLIYLYYTVNKNKIEKVDIFILVISAINILLLLSRTGQVGYFIGLAFFIIYKVYNLGNERTRKIFMIIGIIAVGLGAYIIISKFLNIKFDKTDGGYIRLIYWKTFFTDIWKTSFIFGNGMLYTSKFLQEYAPYYIGENNMHNVILNTWLDFGIVGLISYIGYTGLYIYISFNKRFNLKNVFILLIPFVSILMLQYLGYDNDIVVFLSLIYIVGKYNNVRREI